MEELTDRIKIGLSKNTELVRHVGCAAVQEMVKLNTAGLIMNEIVKEYVE